MPHIVHVTTVEPPYGYTTAEITRELERSWLPDLDPALRRRAEKLLRSTEIAGRRGVVPLEVVLGGRGLGERNRLYANAMIELGTKALRRALEESGTAPHDIGAIITTSCTGIMIPSVDAYLVDRLGLPGDVLRLPVTEMGCAGGTAGLIYARELARARPAKKVALLSLEAPSLTFIRDDHSMENLVSAAIFAHHVRSPVAPGGALVGDAAGFVDPLTGEGIYQALFGARALSAALMEASSFAPGELEPALRRYSRARGRGLSLKRHLNQYFQTVIRRPDQVERLARALAGSTRRADAFLGTIGNVYGPVEGLVRTLRA